MDRSRKQNFASGAAVLALLVGASASFAQTPSTPRPSSPALQRPLSRSAARQTSTSPTPLRAQTRVVRPSGPQRAAVRATPSSRASSVRATRDPAVRPSSNSGSVSQNPARTRVRRGSGDDARTRASRVAKARKNLARLDHYLTTTMAPLERPDNAQPKPDAELGTPIVLTPNASSNPPTPAGLPTPSAPSPSARDRFTQPVSAESGAPR